MQAEFGYPAFTADIKERILGANAQAVYGVTDETRAAAGAARDREWVANASAALAGAIERAG
jgi:hypothetical protein